MDRSRLYKNKNKDGDELRRRRVDQSIELRRAKKDEQMQKRRNILLGELDETSPLKEKQVEVPECVNYDRVIRDMQNSDQEIQFEAVQLCRRTLSKAKDPPIDEFFKRGAVKILIDTLTSDSDPLVFEAAWALTNIASGESSHTAGVVDHGAVPKLIRLLEHNAINVAEQCVWALGNIAGEGARFRDMLVAAGITQPIFRLLDRSWNMPSVVSNIAWVLSNLCRNRDPPPSHHLLNDLLPVLKRLLSYQSKDVVIDTAWAISYASDMNNDFLDDILESGCLPDLLNLLASDLTNIVSPAVRAVGNLVLGDDAQTQRVLDAGLLNYIPVLLNHEKSNVVKEVCWVLSNVTAGNTDQINKVIESNLVPPVLQLICKAEFRIQKEACWVISNIVNGGTAEQCAYLMNQGVLPTFCTLLTVSEVKIVLLVLDAIRKLLEVSKDYGQLDPACIQIETCGGLDKLEELQDHNNNDVYKLAYDIVECYFNNENEDDVNAPTGTINSATGSKENEEFKFLAPEPQSTSETDFQF